jgi:hypothetical protein
MVGVGLEKNTICHGRPYRGRSREGSNTLKLSPLHSPTIHQTGRGEAS